MDVNNFLEVLELKFQTTYVINLCKSIIRLIEEKHNTIYSIEDIKQDVILYFLTNERYKKFRMDSGARISIEVRLKEIYRTKKGYKKPNTYYKELLFMSKNEIETLRDIGYSDTDIRLHAYFYYHRISLKRLNLHSLLMKNNSINIKLKIGAIMRLLAIIYKIEDDDVLVGINNFICYNKRTFLDERFLGIGSTGNIHIDYNKILQYIKTIYLSEVGVIIGD